MHKSKKHLGKIGKDLAISHLIGLGYRVEARNYRCPFGEVDIIARDGEVLVFVEVKTRQSEYYGAPQEAVDLRKQKRLNRIALFYLACLGEGIKQESCRFDIVAISKNPHSGWDIDLIQNAFLPLA